MEILAKFENKKRKNFQIEKKIEDCLPDREKSDSFFRGFGKGQEILVILRYENGYILFQRARIRA